MLVLCPSKSPAHTYMGSLFEFHRGGGDSFPLHYGGIFALKGSAPLSRVYYLAETEEEPPQPRVQ